MQDLKGKVAVVTGAASGIGFGLAERFCSEGMRVVMADIEEAALNDASKRLADTGATVLPVITDVSKADSVDALAARTFEELGTAHVVCNNAGVATGGPMWTLTERDWAWVMGVNLWGVIHGVHAFVPRLAEQGDDAQHARPCDRRHVRCFAAHRAKACRARLVSWRGSSSSGCGPRRCPPSDAGSSASCPGG